ncbi:MAG: hypothetical protein HN970_02130 [Rhodospirillaceae bacterium]|nr:hypothetical protein [Rhodospirillaceae bacterium]
MNHTDYVAEPDARLAEQPNIRDAKTDAPMANHAIPMGAGHGVLSPKHEAFARAYAENANGAAAARSAGYSVGNAKTQAAALLNRDDVTMRVAELDAEIAAERRDALAGFVAKLEPVFGAALEAGDHDTALQTVELQARITGLIHGGATVRPRNGRSTGPEPLPPHEAFLESIGA